MDDKLQKNLQVAINRQVHLTGGGRQATERYPTGNNEKPRITRNVFDQECVQIWVQENHTTDPMVDLPDRHSHSIY